VKNIGIILIISLIIFDLDIEVLFYPQKEKKFKLIYNTAIALISNSMLGRGKLDTSTVTLEG